MIAMKRSTKQRKALLDCLKKSMNPLSVEEIHAHLVEEIPAINISTVYRNLKSLIEEQLICSITVVGGGTRYELLNPQHHHHFHCSRCDRVYNVSFCPQEIAKMVPPGFKMTDHSITLNGYCRDCLEG